MKENKETTCTPCEEKFERNIDAMVKEGEAPTAKERQQREPGGKIGVCRDREGAEMTGSSGIGKCPHVNRAGIFVCAGL